MDLHSPWALVGEKWSVLMNTGKKILVFVNWYEPGYKAGGPIRSCVNFARHMQGDYQVFIFTGDRDLGSQEPYENIRADEWITDNGGLRIFYASPRNLGWREIHREMVAVNPDFIYLNSMFSARFTILPLLIDRAYRLKNRIILSPRGMLRSSALGFKSGKKKLFLNSFRSLGFHKKIRFLAADETEVKDVYLNFGRDAKATLIPNFPAALSAPAPAPEKKRGELSLIYIGRIHPIKNLDYLLNVLKEAQANIRLTIVGSLEDKTFWLACQEIIRALPANVRVTYDGEIPNDQLPAITSRHHVFILPTRGENFGHAIFEALVLGRPVLISDQTPWKDLEAAGAGWDLPLGSPTSFLGAIEQAAAFDQDEYENRCLATWKYIKNYVAQLNLKEEYLKLFS
jgi:glycosyltransferase involved in cell wall biosynthesis